MLLWIRLPSDRHRRRTWKATQPVIRWELFHSSNKQSIRLHELILPVKLAGEIFHLCLLTKSHYYCLECRFLKIKSTPIGMSNCAPSFTWISQLFFPREWLWLGVYFRWSIHSSSEIQVCVNNLALMLLQRENQANQYQMRDKFVNLLIHLYGSSLYSFLFAQITQLKKPADDLVFLSLWSLKMILSLQFSFSLNVFFSIWTRQSVILIVLFYRRWLWCKKMPLFLQVTCLNELIVITN